MKQLQLLAAVAMMLFSLGASANCYISVKACKPMQLRSAATFQDGDDLANAEPHRCLQRARAYLNWCNSGDSVNAAFYEGPILTIGVAVTKDNSTLFTVDKAKRTIYLAPNY